MFTTGTLWIVIGILEISNQEVSALPYLPSADAVSREIQGYGNFDTSNKDDDDNNSNNPYNPPPIQAFPEIPAAPPIPVQSRPSGIAFQSLPAPQKVPSMPNIPSGPGIPSRPNVALQNPRFPSVPQIPGQQGVPQPPSIPYSPDSQVKFPVEVWCGRNCFFASGRTLNRLSETTTETDTTSRKVTLDSVKAITASDKPKCSLTL